MAQHPQSGPSSNPLPSPTSVAGTGDLRPVPASVSEGGGTPAPTWLDAGTRTQMAHDGHPIPAGHSHDLIGCWEAKRRRPRAPGCDLLSHRLCLLSPPALLPSSKWPQTLVVPQLSRATALKALSSCFLQVRAVPCGHQERGTGRRGWARRGWSAVGTRAGSGRCSLSPPRPGPPPLGMWTTTTCVPCPFYSTHDTDVMSPCQAALT